MTSQAHPTLYILMRTDMASLNPGKAMAQAAHAANVFMHRAYTMPEGTRMVGFAEWTGDVNYGDYPEEAADAVVQSKGAGTTITLAVGSEKELREIVDAAHEDGFAAGLYRDPSYPIRDGLVTHLLPLVTCGYIFSPCRLNSRPSCLSGLSLHP